MSGASSSHAYATKRNAKWLKAQESYDATLRSPRSSSDAMGSTWSSLTEHETERHNEMIKRRLKTEEMRKFYDAQVAEKVEKNRLEAERRKQYAKELAQERELWQKMDESEKGMARKKAMEEKAERDEQVLRVHDRKVAKLEQEVRDHMMLMDRLGQEGEKAKQAKDAKSKTTTEWFLTTHAQAMEMTTTRKELAITQRSEDAIAMAAYTGLIKKYEDHQKEKVQTKVQIHRDEAAKIRKDRAEAAAESRKAAMKLDMEQLRARNDVLERQENEKLEKSQMLRTQQNAFVQKQLVERKDQQQKEFQELKKPPTPLPVDGGFGTSQKIMSRDLVTAHVWDFARSEAGEKARRREMSLRNKKDLEAQISARGRPLPGLNIKKRPVEPPMDPKENKKVIDEMASTH